jgi:hypothetical protein
MTALYFEIRNHLNGRSLAHATVCEEVRYAAVAWLRVRGFERRFAPSGLWHDARLQCEEGFGAEAVSPTTAVPLILIEADLRAACGVYYRQTERIVVETRFQVAPTLEARLRALALAA